MKSKLEILLSFLTIIFALSIPLIIIVAIWSDIPNLFLLKLAITNFILFFIGLITVNLLD